MHITRIPFVKKKYSEGCFVDNRARKKPENVKRIESLHGKQYISIRDKHTMCPLKIAM
jgi:hypothetical protein